MSKHANRQYNLRMPDHLKEKLRQKAENDQRSLNSLILKVLQEWIEKHEINQTVT